MTEKKSMRMKTGIKTLALAGAASVGLAFGVVDASASTFSFINGTRAASVDFSVSGTALTVVLTNTSGFDSDVPTDLLTAVFWDNANDADVSRNASSTALLTAGSSVVYDPQGQPVGGNVGGEYAYVDGLSGAPGGTSAGISSTGLGLFGQNNLNGPNLAGPTAVDGPQYGILSAGWVAAGDNGGLTGSGGLIFNSVTFVIAVTAGFSLDSISNIWFQYGTDLAEPSFAFDPDPPEVPLPAAFPLLVTALAGLGFLGRRRKAV